MTNIYRTQQLGVLTSSETNEWYTPKYIITAARDVLGSIDLDPASCLTAQNIVQASSYFDIEQDGLRRPWHGKVWLNPPYGTNESNDSLQWVWAQKLRAEYSSGNVTEAIMLTKAVPGYVWWDTMFNEWRIPCCIGRGCIAFVPPLAASTGEVNGTGRSKTASTFWYFGQRCNTFERIFKAIGRVIL